MAGQCVSLQSNSSHPTNNADGEGESWAGTHQEPMWGAVSWKLVPCEIICVNQVSPCARPCAGCCTFTSSKA